MTLAIVGAGQAGLQIAESLRRGGYSGRLVLMGEESWPPYQRPPLSKKFLAGELAPERLWFRPLAQLEKQGIEFLGHTRVTAIDRAARTLRCADGSTLAWSGLALATGTRVRPLPVPGAEQVEVAYLRGLDDALELKTRLTTAARVLVIGGGFIGLEVAATARLAGREVTVLETLDRLMARAVSPLLSQWFADLHRARGVDLRLGTGLAALERTPGGTLARLSDGSELKVDLVIAGIGVLPNQELAQAAGLSCANGIVVDEYARTSDPDIVAAGDCTWHRNLRYAPDGHRLESVQNAVDQAKVAAASLLGQPAPYQELPWFWSDQYDVKLQMAGLAVAGDQPVQRGNPAGGAFAVFHFRADRLVAVDAINRPAEHMLARRLLGAGLSPTPSQAADEQFDLKSLLPTT